MQDWNLKRTGKAESCSSRHGMVVAWGSSQNGKTNVPAGLDNVISIAARNQHSLALRSDGTVVAWGSNTNRNMSTVPAGLEDVISIASGPNYLLAITTTGLITSINDPDHEVAGEISRRNCRSARLRLDMLFSSADRNY